MEIITGIERRRNWPLEQKLAVLAEASHESESAASVARRHDIRPQMISSISPRSRLARCGCRKPADGKTGKPSLSEKPEGAGDNSG
jgi:transposase-like protein